jgi:hypothetical protein
MSIRRFVQRKQANGESEDAVLSHFAKRLSADDDPQAIATTPLWTNITESVKALTSPAGVSNQKHSVRPMSKPSPAAMNSTTAAPAAAPSPNFEQYRQGAVSASSLISVSSPPHRGGLSAKRNQRQKGRSPLSYPSLVQQSAEKSKLSNQPAAVATSGDYWSWLSEQQSLRDDSVLFENRRNLPLSISQLSNSLRIDTRCDRDDEKEGEGDEEGAGNCDQGTAPPLAFYKIHEDRIKIDWNCRLNPKPYPGLQEGVGEGEEERRSMSASSNDLDTDSSESTYSHSSSYYRGVRDVVSAADLVMESVRKEMEEEEKKRQRSSPTKFLTTKDRSGQRVLYISDAASLDSEPLEPNTDLLRTSSTPCDLSSSPTSDLDPESLSLPSLKLLYDSLEERVGNIETDVEELKQKTRRPSFTPPPHSPSLSPSSVLQSDAAHSSRPTSVPSTPQSPGHQASVLFSLLSWITFSWLADFIF